MSRRFILFCRLFHYCKTGIDSNNTKHDCSNREKTGSPKVYWRDTGLLHALLNVTDEHALLNQPWVGASWEGFVIEQILATLTSVGRHFDAYWFRTSDQYELDLVLAVGSELWAIEVILTTAPSSSDMTHFNKTSDMIGATHRFLVSRHPTVMGDKKQAACHLDWLIDQIVDSAKNR